MVLSPKRLWETYDRSLLPLELSEIACRQTENGTESRLYFNGEATALGCTRIFARLIASAQKTEKLIIILPEPEQDVCAADFSFLSDNDRDILIVDYAGNAFDHERYTIYPSALSFSDYNAQSLYKPVENPQKSCWYIWTTVALRAVTFAQSLGYTHVAMCGFGSGGASVLKAAAVTDYPVCALTFFSPGFFPESEDPELLGTNISMDVRGYAPLLKIPFLQLCCSNDTDASLNEINEFTEQAAQSSQKATLYIAPRVHKSLPKEMTANAVTFLSAYLNGDPLPDIHAFAPDITFTASGADKKMYFSLQCAQKLRDVKFYVSHGIKNPAYRNWRTISTEKAGELEYIGFTDVFSSDRPVYAFCAVTTENGFTYCSPVLEKVPSALHILPSTIIKRRLIYESDMGLDDFFTTVDQDPPFIKEGPFGIEGICAKRGLCTFKIGDVAFGGAPDSVLQLLLFSSVPQNITFSVTDEDQFITYTCTKTVSPDTDWTKIMLSASDFKSADGFFVGWHRAILLRIDAEEEFIISSLLWV